MYFLHIFPQKQVLKKKRKNSAWITQGIKVSRQRLQLLHLLKRKMSQSASTLNYIKKHQSIYKKILSVARKRENDRIISRSKNHTKALWQIIKNESGNCQKTNQNIFLEIGSMSVTNTTRGKNYYKESRGWITRQRRQCL
jgi:uncharacterized protein YpiB (UPF0302 family)